jgi:hypothetical protein
MSGVYLAYAVNALTAEKKEKDGVIRVLNRKTEERTLIKVC